MEFKQHKHNSPGNSSDRPFFQKERNTISGESHTAFFNTSPIQPKLTVNQPDDSYEKEADSMADKVVQRRSNPDNSVMNATTFSNTSRSVKQYSPLEQEIKLQKEDKKDEKDLPTVKLQKKPIFETNAQPLDSETNNHRKCTACEKEEQLQKKSDNNSSTTAPNNVESSLSSSKGRGNPLPPGTLAEMGSSFGANFSAVRIFNGNAAVSMTKDLNAQAFTHGSDIYFNSGKYNPETAEGRHLLAHELTHVVQQSNVIQRQKIPAADATQKAYKINYKNAGIQNRNLSKPDSLGWESKLETVAGGLYKGWFDLWKAGNYDGFADAVAQYQSDKGLKKNDVDGILGLGTWAKIGGYGEAIAGIETVQWERSKDTCTIASEERIKRGHKLATGNKFELAKDKSKKTFNIILQSIEGRMGDIDEMYRGTGAAGAMVYSGFATYVAEADIWTGGLRPGAPMQVWGDRDAYNLLREGVVKYKVRGVTKTRPIKPDDANFYGTSFVFVRYDNPKNPTKMLVRHFDQPEWKSKTDYQVWVAANLN